MITGIKSLIFFLFKVLSTSFCVSLIYFSEQRKRRSGSRTATTFKMERFVIIVNDFKPLNIITKRSILDVTAALYPPLKRKSLQIANTRKPVLKAPKTVHRGACFEESRKSTVYNFTTEWLEHKTEKLSYFSSVFITSYHLIHKMIAAYLSSYITF